jgi:hypothetical protein
MEIHDLVNESLSNPPKRLKDRFIDNYIDESMRITKQFIPDICEEMLGICEAAKVEFRDLFFASCEELWDYEDLPSVPERCTDLLCAPGSTSSKLTCLLHTNDEKPGYSPRTIRISVTGKPSILGITRDPYFFSFAVNSFGMVFSGNALACDDLKPGIPRLLTYRAGLESVDIHDAMSMFLNPFRSSSYNNIVLNGSGDFKMVEGTSSSAAEIRPDKDICVHTNHYDILTSKDLNLRPESSMYRRQKAQSWALNHHGKIDVDMLKDLAGDHGNGGHDGICRHAPDRSTCFAVIVVPQLGELHYSPGSPCKTQWTKWNYW